MILQNAKRFIVWYNKKKSKHNLLDLILKCTFYRCPDLMQCKLIGLIEIDEK